MFTVDLKQFIRPRLLALVLRSFRLFLTKMLADVFSCVCMCMLDTIVCNSETHPVPGRRTGISLTEIFRGPVFEWHWIPIFWLQDSGRRDLVPFLGIFHLENIWLHSSMTNYDYICF